MGRKHHNKSDEERARELHDRVSTSLKAIDGKNFLETYALYMLRVQTYELSLKQDLQELFDVSEEHAERMNLSAIYRFYVDNDVRAHPILYRNIKDVAQQRNALAHEFLAVAGSAMHLAGEESLRLFARDLDKWLFELELAYQQYVMLKEIGTLYQDWGVKPE